MFSKLGLFVLRGLGYLPLSWLRALGSGLGALLLVAIPSRRRIVQTNLRVCFPHSLLRLIEKLGKKIVKLTIKGLAVLIGIDINTAESITPEIINQKMEARKLPKEFDDKLFNH
jgi:lauroyl/myristoyl acyltransferase